MKGEWLAKSHFYLKVMNETKGNSKEIWKNIKSVIGREQHSSGDIVQGKSTKSNVTIASTFNSFFTESVKSLLQETYQESD